MHKDEMTPNLFLYDMEKNIPTEVLQEFTAFMVSDHWLEGVPGGFLSNSPKRKVNAFGNGGYETTYWTAQMKTATATLHTKPNPLPPAFQRMIPYLKGLFREACPDAKMTDGTFSIGVCNYYTKPDMYIAAHTDDNVWYPKECSLGNVFASITLYPEGPPKDGYYSRFQIRPNDKWEQVDLPHNSVMIMPSSMEHRVQPFKKSDYKHFKPRINVTFRSVFPKDVDPLMNFMAIANHARYYRIPHAVTLPPSISGEMADDIVNTYITFCDKYDYPFDVYVEERNRKSAIDNYRQFALEQGYPDFKVTNNMVPEVFSAIMG